MTTEDRDVVSGQLGAAEPCADCKTLPTTKATAPYCEACYEILHALWSDEEVSHSLLASVYRQLAKRLEVRDALEKLYSLIGPQLEAVAPGQRLTPTADQWRSVVDFAKRWHLPPQRGPRDVLSSLELRAEYRRSLSTMRPELAAVSQHIAEPILSPRFTHGTRIGERVRGEMVEPEVIAPYMPAPFQYDPTTMSARRVQDHAELEATRVRRSILDEAEKIRGKREGEGWKRLPSRYLEPGTMEESARLLAGKMAGRSWGELAGQGSRRRASSTVIERVEGLAQRLGIPLPRGN